MTRTEYSAHIYLSGIAAATARIKELDEEIDPGLLMGVQVYAMNMYIEDVLLLPRNAVQYDGGKAYVEVVSGAGTSVRYVITGPNDGENIMILAGLEEGTAVLEK